MMRVLITGGAGFIGSNLAKYHVQKGDEVIVIDNLSTGRIENIKALQQQSNFTFYKKDLLKWKGLTQALVGVDRIYHMAAVVGMFHVLNHPVETLKCNIFATLKLMEAIRSIGSKPLVLIASSSEVYGNQHKTMSENTPLIIESSITSHASYVISKLSDESIGLSFWHKHQIPTIILRLFNTVGRNQLSRYGMVVPRLIKQALHNDPITVFGDGTQKRSFCNVEDSVNLIDRLANNSASVGEIVNVGFNEDISINTLAKKIKKICTSQSTITHIPFSEVYHNDFIYIADRKPDISKLLRLTHYTYKWNIDTTIADIAAYFKQIGIK
ncbi:NAD-dependent epimerase/dehydratase family protein [Legionella saoudiensis]|uniref:NAD-dependent epimerase/dehydratase family protein n=1 Tax=Legionella saoudiensis TaxID=1750561 RepID=UPI00098FFAC1|nr:NAD-dependent epimerase/dehydratase family protein [Legionella saoudiensis]